MRAARPLLAMLSALVCLATAAAQDYPRKPIRLVVGYAPGGSTDVVARLVAGKLSELIGQQVVVENRSGANGNIASEAVVRSPADGYTLFIGGAASSINESLYKNLPFSFPKDFAPVAFIGSTPSVMVVPKASRAKSPEEFFRDAKAGLPVNFASSGVGATTHLSGELFKMLTGLEMTHIPYRGSAPALQDLVAGQVQVMFDNLISATPVIRSGELRALGTTGAVRSPSFPDLPTLKEQGYDVVVLSWTAIFAPARTPKPVIDLLNGTMKGVLETPQVRERLASLGVEPQVMTPDELKAYAVAEVEKFRKVVTASGAKVE